MSVDIVFHMQCFTYISNHIHTSICCIRINEPNQLRGLNNACLCKIYNLRQQPDKLNHVLGCVQPLRDKQQQRKLGSAAGLSK